mgnify:CR=1 FL=1
MTFREVEKLLLTDGWKVKPGKVTIPNHSGDLDKKTVHSILKQAGLK